MTWNVWCITTPIFASYHCHILPTSQHVALSHVFQSCIFHPCIFEGPIFSIPAFSVDRHTGTPWMLSSGWLVVCTHQFNNDFPLSLSARIEKLSFVPVLHKNKYPVAIFELKIHQYAFAAWTLRETLYCSPPDLCIRLSRRRGTKGKGKEEECHLLVICLPRAQLRSFLLLVVTSAWLHGMLITEVIRHLRQRCQHFLHFHCLWYLTYARTHT